MTEGKDNLSNDSNSVTPEQIVCAPSLPGSPPLTPSPKRSSPRGNLAGSPNSMQSSGSLHHVSHQHATSHHQQQTAMLRPLLTTDHLTGRLAESPHNSQIDRQNVELALRLSSSATSTVSTVTNTNTIQNDTGHTNKQTVLNINKKNSGASGVSSIGQPQIFVKQGVSKCKECNIVFCKYENYLAHKKHYCSARNLDDKDGGKPSPPPSPVPSNLTPGTAPPLAYQQLICAACGIKFTSLDNLSAHQMYYCPKRIEVAIQVSFCHFDFVRSYIFYFY